MEDPYPSLSDFHDYEPNLEFDDSDLLQQKHPENDDGMIFFSIYFPLFLIYTSRVLLFHQIWIVNYFVKFSSDNLSNENKNIGVSREMIFKKWFNLAF